MKKVLILMLAMVIVLSLAACGGRGSENGISNPSNNADVQTTDNPKETAFSSENFSKDSLYGHVVNFGGYRWLILKTEETKMLIISEDVIMEKAYHESGIASTWADCSLRTYLNNEFYNTFNAADKAMILETTNYGVKDDKDTKDKIFLLNEDEVNRYFTNNGDRIARYQYYGSENDTWFAGESWWLRSPMNYGVDYNGAVSNVKPNISEKCGIRPVMWINITSEIHASEISRISVPYVWGTKPFDSVQINDRISFDAYTWRVLSKENGKVLIIMDDVFATYEFSDDSNILWEDNPIRAYLNGDFYNTFSAVEQAKILETDNSNPDFYDIDDGQNETKDKIFLLSHNEIFKYFKDNGDRIVRYCLDFDNDIWDGNGSFWWMRSATIADKDRTGYVIKEVENIPFYVDNVGSITTSHSGVQTRNYGIRPAMWIGFE